MRHRDFRLYWLGSMVSLAGTQMQQAAIAWQIYGLSHSAVALGLIGLARVVPIVTLSLGGGVVADVVERRKLLVVTQSAQLLLSASLAALTLTGLTRLWMIYLVTALAAASLAFDNPARQAMVPSLVPRELLSTALSLNSTAFQIAMVAGPSLAGVLIASAGVGSVYVVDAVSFLAVLGALLAIHPPPTLGAINRISLSAAVDGVRFMRHEPVLLPLMLLDFAATFFASATALLPIFATQVLHVGAHGYGLLYAAPALGAALTAAVMAGMVGRIRAEGKVILAAVALYGTCTIGFGLSTNFLLSLLALAGTGVADTVSMILRQTIRQIRTPDAMRGRMASVNMVFFMGGPQLGEMEAGLVARSFGAPFSVVAGGVGALGAVLLLAVVAPALRGLRDTQR